MSLHEQMKNNIKEALKNGDKVRLEVMRSIVTSLTNELLNKGKTPQELLNDEEVLVVITRLSKQRKDSIEQYTKGNRFDLVDEETLQLNILNEYLPKLMEIAEIENFVKQTLNKEEKIDTTKKGMFISLIMKELKGKADGALVKQIIDKLYI